MSPDTIVPHAEWPPRFQFSSEVWPGLAKLSEECGELVQVISKIVGTAGTMRFRDGSTVDPERMIEELGDVWAAVEFVYQHAFTPEERRRIINRRTAKYDLFNRWRAEEAQP